MKKDNFVNFTDSYDFFHLFCVRKSILDALKKNMSSFRGTHMDLGCGTMPYKELILSNKRVIKYIGMDLHKDGIHKDHYMADIYWDGITMPLPDNSIDSMHATEVFEHCSNVSVVFKEIHRVLKPGGSLFFTVPFLFQLHEVPNDFYRYTPFVLEKLFKETGFNNIKLEARGGWNASMAQMISLWIFGQYQSHKVRLALFIILRPFVRLLLRNDKKPQFASGPMITGVSGLVTK